MASFKSQNEKRFYILEIFSAVVGIITSFYLLIQHTRLTNGIQDGASFCSLGKYADCDIVNGSQYAELFGLPLGAWGAIYFYTLLVLILIAPPRDKSFRFSQGILGWLLVLGLLIDVVYLGVQVFSLKTVCLMCLLTYAANIGTFVAALRLTNTVGSIIQNLLLETNDWIKPGLKTQRFIFATVSWVLFSLVVLLAPAQIVKNSANYVHADQAIESFFAQWKEKPTRKFEASEGNGTWGNPNAKVVIVEFSDFECPFCRKAAFTLHTVLKPYKDRVYFIFKNFPLDSTCNPGVPYQIHAHACKLAKLSMCGARQGKFWDVHDELFLKLQDEDFKKGFDFISGSLKSIFNETEISQCLQDPKVAQYVLEDAKLGQSLNVRGTPTIYINGKHYSIPLTVDNLRKTIELEESLVK